MSVPSFLQFTPVELVQRILDRLEIFSGHLGVSPNVVFWVFIGWLAIMGLAGFHLARLYVSVGAASLVFYVSVVGFEHLVADHPVLAILPHFMGYALGFLLAFLVFFLAWKLTVPAIYVTFAVVGFYLTSLFVTNVWLCVAAGVLASILASFAINLLFIALTSALAGFGVTAFLGAIFPARAALQLGGSMIALWIAIAISVVFLIFQCATTKSYKKIGL